jgi:hypothetical protein
MCGAPKIDGTDEIFAKGCCFLMPLRTRNNQEARSPGIFAATGAARSSTRAYAAGPPPPCAEYARTDAATNPRRVRVPLDCDGRSARATIHALGGIVGQNRPAPQHAETGGGAPANPAVRALYICLDLLASQDEYRRAVHEHDVLQLAKELLASEYAAEEDESYEHDASDITECTIHSDIAAALERTGARVEASYVRTRKLTAGEACDMLKAIEEFCSHAAEDECKGWTQYLDPDALNGGAREKLLKIFENVRTLFRLELRKLLADSE